MIHKQVGESTRLWLVKQGYKAHVCSTPDPEEVLCYSYAFTNSKRTDSKMAPDYFLRYRRPTMSCFLLQTLLMIANIYKLQICVDIFPVNPLTHEMRNKLKSHRRRVLSYF